MTRKGKRKGKGIIESQDSQLQETQSTRPSFNHNEVCEQELSQILHLSSEPQTDERAHQASNSIIIGSITLYTFFLSHLLIFIIYVVVWLHLHYCTFIIALSPRICIMHNSSKSIILLQHHCKWLVENMMMILHFSFLEV